MFVKLSFSYLVADSSYNVVSTCGQCIHQHADFVLNSF
jgi:hypothetical protein